MSSHIGMMTGCFPIKLIIVLLVTDERNLGVRSTSRPLHVDLIHIHVRLIVPSPHEWVVL